MNTGMSGAPAARARMNGPDGNDAGAPKKGTRRVPTAPSDRSSWRATISFRRSARIMFSEENTEVSE
jgi:hypothetical protein